MALVVTFNGSNIASGSFAQGDDQAVGSGEAEDDVTLASVPEITVTSIEVSLWSKRVVFTHGQTFPFTLSGGTPLACTIGSQNPPLIELDPPLAGASTGRVTISYTEAGVENTFWFEYAVRLVDNSLDPDDFPTFEEWVADWLFDVYSFGSAVATVDNPLSLGWGLEDPDGGGHLEWAQTYLPLFALQGGVNVLMFQPGGALQHIITPFTGDFVFDWWLHAQAYGASSGETQNYDTFEAALDWMIDQDLIPWVYIGTMRQSADFLALRQQPLLFVERILASVNWGLRRDMGFMFDSPASRSQDISASNPHIVAGEQRYESLDWIRQIKARQGLETYVEPRLTSAETDWHDWGHIAQGTALYRANPDWYSDAAGVASDTEITGPIADFVIDGSNALMPYQLAEIFQRGYQAVCAVSFNWVNQGGLLVDLYSIVKNHLRYIRGVTLEAPFLLGSVPATPSPPFEIDPDSFSHP